MPMAVGAGAASVVLGRMTGPDGAKFRLPPLIGLFGFAALSAAISNKAMSLAVVLVAPPARLPAAPGAEVAARWPVAVSLPAGARSAPGPERPGRYARAAPPSARCSPACRH